MMPGFGGGSPWGNAPPNIAAWLDANWGNMRGPLGGGPNLKPPPPGGWPAQGTDMPELGPLPPAGSPMNVMQRLQQLRAPGGALARPPLLNGRVPLGANKLVSAGYNPGNPMNVGQMAPVPMKNPPPPGSLLAALFNAKGPLPPQGFAGTMPPPGGVPPTGLPMGVRQTTPAPLTAAGGPPLTPQGMDPNYQALFGLAPNHFAMPAAQTNSTFGNVGKGWPFV